jgi:hypothetical protein
MPLKVIFRDGIKIQGRKHAKINAMAAATPI